ncbi:MULTISPECIES: amino acid permease [Salinibaculum]|uniref:amino acid permease n=1 Tax=Salinibaculum TaxID=2732368 RepID=UPI0030D0167F
MVEHTRTLGFKIAFAMGLGTMIAAGIFSLSGTAVSQIGSSAVIAFVIAAVVAGITAASYSEFASIYAENGGGYLFSSQTFEDRELLVYGIGASLFLGYTGTTAFYLATMDEWFFQFIIPKTLALPEFVPMVDALTLPHGTVGVVAALLLGGLNARGTEESGAFQLIVTSAKVAVLLVFIGGAIAFAGIGGSAGEFTGSFQNEPVGIISIAATAFITFFGFSAIAASAGEIIEPRKTVPKAIAASMVTVTVLYTLVIVALVNVPAEHRELLQLGETAMGEVAQVFIGPAGQALIVAGAVFSMVSASNASILAASGIGSLMGRQGQAPRRFSRIHPRFGTPFWSVSSATGVIVALIVLFIAVIPHSLTLPAVGEVTIGLSGLTGFATFNLLLPLSAVNLALIYSRRKYPELDRPFRVPLVPVLPIIGILANLALITNLPTSGVVAGVLVVIAVVVGYLIWGGAPHVEDLFEEIEPATPAGEGEPENDRYRVLVPIARPERAPTHVRLASLVAQSRDDDPFIEVLNVTQIPEQTPNEMVTETASKRVDRVREALSGVDIDTEYAVEGHICRDIAFDITQTARNSEADLILMGYPEEHHEVTESVAYNAPCDVVFARGFEADTDLRKVHVGAGAGPHHLAALPLVDALGSQGTEINLVSVSATQEGTPEDPGETLSRLSADVTTVVHKVTASSVADGLVATVSDEGGVLLIGASRDRRLRQWVFGSTPDQVIELADSAGVPVLIYSSSIGMRGQLEDWLFPVYRYLRKVFGRTRRQPQRADEQEA